MKLNITKYFMILIVVLLAGCETMGKRADLLEITTDNYHNAIRWGLFNVAENFRAADGSEKHATDFERLRKIKVTAYKSVNKQFSEDGKEARQTVEIRYYHKDYMVEKVLIDKQLWKYDSKKKEWRLQSGLPDFK